MLAEVGKPMPDFSARTFSGKDFKLSTLKGKYIYLTFGAAGCAPCRFENKLIRNHYDSLSNKIAFVNFSTDRTKKAWETTTQYDKIVWDNVSDLGMKYGQVKDLYNVQAMPTSFLIDKNGLIIKKFIGYSPDLIEVITKAVQ